MRSTDNKQTIKKIRLYYRNYSYNADTKKSSKLLPLPTLYLPQSHKLKDPSLSSSVSSDINKNYQDEMEDFTLMISPFKLSDNDKKHHLFAIFDGHGGFRSAEISKRKYPSILRQCLKDNPIKIEESLKRSFLFLDHEAYINQCTLVGNTATIVYFANKMLYCANVGDSRCVVITGNKTIKQMSYDDNCYDPNERKRVEEKGGTFTDNRLEGVLAVTRAIGDFEFKEKGLISVPHVNKHMIDPSDLYCVIASDGVWDVLGNEDLINIMIESKTEKDFSSKIVEFALKNGSTDNISCIVIKFFQENI